MADNAEVKEVTQQVQEVVLEYVITNSSCQRALLVSDKRTLCDLDQIS